MPPDRVGPETKSEEIILSAKFQRSRESKDKFQQKERQTINEESSQQNQYRN
jgi:hypothetical protein